MRVVVPFDATAPKTRLAPLFDARERAALARVMLADVLDALDGVGVEPTVLSTAALECSVPVEVDDRPLTEAVNGVLESTAATVAVVMADLPLLSAGCLDRLFEATAEVVLAPGRAGGTNAFVCDHPDFRVDYHGASYLDHLAVAESVGASVTTVDSHRLATDVDEVADLVEVLVHGPETETHAWLADHDVELAIDDGRVGIDRG